MVRTPQLPHEKEPPQMSGCRRAGVSSSAKRPQKDIPNLPRSGPRSLPRASFLEYLLTSILSILCLWPCFKRSKAGGLGACPHKFLVCKKKSDSRITSNNQLALFRANTRNAVELEKFLRKKGAQNLEAAGQRKPSLDPSDPDEFDRQMAEQHGPPPDYSEQTSGPSTQPGNSQTRSAMTQQDRPTESKGGWFGGKKIRQPDPERGHELANPDDPSNRNKSTIQKARN